MISRSRSNLNIHTHTHKIVIYRFRSGRGCFHHFVMTLSPPLSYRHFARARARACVRSYPNKTATSSCRLSSHHRQSAQNARNMFTFHLADRRAHVNIVCVCVCARAPDADVKRELRSHSLAGGDEGIAFAGKEGSSTSHTRAHSHSYIYTGTRVCVDPHSFAKQNTHTCTHAEHASKHSPCTR